MATSPSVAENPPPYITANQNDADEVVQPVILVLTGQRICAQASGMTPLYELSQDIRQPSHGESKASFSRVTWNVRTNADGTPRVTQRNRHIFDLKHLPSLLLKGFPYCLDPVSRSAAGKLGLKTLSFPRSGFKMVRLEPEKGDGLPKGYKAVRRSDREVGTMFEIRKKHGHYEWIGPDGRRLAVEDDVADERKLIVTAPTNRGTVDAMVASWSLRIWHNCIESNPENLTTYILISHDIFRLGLTGLEFAKHRKKAMAIFSSDSLPLVSRTMERTRRTVGDELKELDVRFAGGTRITNIEAVGAERTEYARAHQERLQQANRSRWPCSFPPPA
ncbi:hypothetical protein DL768_003294 [Monosporascus sp. mg162]|nr:hypothetical protein DL768_003294 [Monosporascus sp. mg162]